MVRIVKEVISRIREAETQADELKKAAVQKAKEIEAAAGAAGREAQARIKAEHAAQAAAILEEAGRQADGLVSDARATAAREGEALAAQAAGRLDAAATLIVERIVGAK